MAAQAAMKKKFLLRYKKPARVLVLVLALAAISAPALIVGLSPGGFSNVSFSALRVLGLYAFTLLFMSIVTGAARTQFYMIFRPKRVYNFHIAAGVLGFGFALAHGVIVLVTKHYVGHSGIWVIGPVTLGLLVLTIYVAFDKRRLAHVWRAIHIINYAIFVGIFIKAMTIGTDVRTIDTTAHVMRVIMVAYVVIAAGAVGLRLRGIAERRNRARGKEEHGRIATD